MKQIYFLCFKNIILLPILLFPYAVAILYTTSLDSVFVKKGAYANIFKLNHYE